MNYLITAAGLGSRYLKEGIKPPKPLIKVKGTELLLWSLKSFDFNPKDFLYIVTLKRDKVKNFLLKKINLIYPQINIYWLELEEHLNGQLLTSLNAINFFKIKGEILIHNCDTSYKLECENIKKIFEKNAFGIIPYFNSEGKNWSFIKIKKDLIIQVKEKERISKNCSVGTYLFKDAEEFYNLANQYLKEIKNNLLKEFFIAPFYDYAITKNKKIYPIKCNHVMIYGTCAELLKTFDISFNELLSENDFNGNQRKTIVVDIDGTFCGKPVKGDYSKCNPIEEVCEKIRFENSIGTYIILYTSRNMRSFNGNIGLINKYTSSILTKWLFENKIPYDELYFGKPWGKDLSYIDDKSLPIEKFIYSSKVK